GDGLISTTSGSLLAVLTADCLPVLVADTRTHAVGAFHAGWRGTLAGVVRNGLAQMRKRYDTRPTDVIAALGPCIRSCCFEVGEEVRDTFLKQTPELQSCFLPERAGTLRMDLVAANKQQLLQEGVLPERIQVVGQCTACSRTAEGGRRYFSYRAEKTRTGRMLSGIAVIA
ncbi:MAG: peptidoglycan editing factor PgeF, partial [Rhodospirillales bacterium]|nr:peptidoglycan editing factor PgeF [Acetobacter sp.]